MTHVRNTRKLIETHDGKRYTAVCPAASGEAIQSATVPSSIGSPAFSKTKVHHPRIRGFHNQLWFKIYVSPKPSQVSRGNLFGH